jgi:hypothetical protein
MHPTEALLCYVNSESAPHPQRQLLGSAVIEFGRARVRVSGADTSIDRHFASGDRWGTTNSVELSGLRRTASSGHWRGDLSLRRPHESSGKSFRAP